MAITTRGAAEGENFFCGQVLVHPCCGCCIRLKAAIQLQGYSSSVQGHSPEVTRNIARRCTC